MPIAILCMKLGPYHIARLRALSELPLSFVVIEVAGKEAVYHFWGESQESSFPVRTLFPGEELEAVPAAAQVRQLQAVLDELQPTALVIPGYDRPVLRAAIRWANRHQAPAILQSSTWELGATDFVRAKRRYWLKEKVKRYFIRRWFAAAMVAGEWQRAYAEKLGIAPQWIWRGYMTVDNDHFATGAAQVRQEEEKWRRVLGLPGAYFLWVGRMVPCKNLGGLLHAYSRYRQEGGTWGLVLVGEGPERAQWEDWARRAQLPEVVFTGAQPYEKLPRYYGLARCLILPSESEPWGGVVNEAMAAGLPVLVSRRCGCVPELVYPGINGWSFNPFVPSELTSLMHHVSERVDWKAAGEASRQIIAKFTPRHWALVLYDCLQRLGKV